MPFAVIFALLGLAAGGGAWWVLGADEAASGTEADFCSVYFENVRRFGRGGGGALTFRQVQHQAGREGYQSGGWMGAIIGAFTGAGDAGSRMAACGREHPGAVADAANQHRAMRDARRKARRAARDTRRVCIDGCPRGRAGKECRKACRAAHRETMRAARDAARGADGRSAFGSWAGTFAP